MTKLNSVLSEIAEHVFTSCRVAVAPRSGKCLDLNAMNFSKFFLICILLQLALNIVNARVHVDRDCDSPQHAHSTDEHDLYSGQESRSCGV